MWPPCSVQLSRPWWALCFVPLSPTSPLLSSPSSSEASHYSYLCFSLGLAQTHTLLSACVSPTTSARSRLLSLPPCVALRLLWLFLSHSQVHVSIMWRRFYPQPRAISFCFALILFFFMQPLLPLMLSHAGTDQVSLCWLWFMILTAKQALSSRSQSATTFAAPAATESKLGCQSSIFHIINLIIITILLTLRTKVLWFTLLQSTSACVQRDLGRLM